MAMLVNCGKCGTQLSMEQEYVGVPFQCPSCNAIFTVPRPGSTGPIADGTPMASAPSVPGGGRAIASFFLGVSVLLARCIPIVGFPMAIVGLVLGIKGLKGPRSGLATAGIVLNGIGLLAVIGNIVIAVYLGATGQHLLLDR
ncbi:MAG: hypothetical protein JXQ73_11675 [Phycisphaerae bacterium]|nr:hypothetical protein [Phycisphaerae bacterium]